ncbi:SNF2 family N-terminal domain-containing protein [Corynascus novoguineensis]|uniref:SNF2 family N-terminal domain-containing protein n=1 Tax=Corynascus novoguineensis TaxID=1126955 RepID=A0AAN7CYV5_9PEZI|nr:SNF2 family N-terminal domain-containing protein [Corynascus novoguineensis]
MDSARDDFSPSSTVLPPVRDRFDDSTSILEQLSDDLAIQRAVLASLDDLPDSSPKKRDIADVKARIADITRQITRVRGKGHSTSATMGANEEYSRPRDISTASSKTTLFASDLGEGHAQDSGTPTRKRSIGSSHLAVHPPSRSTHKSRRTTPNLASETIDLDDFGGFDEGLGDQVIDLTCDDDSVWRSAIKRQKEAEERASRIKAEMDRDAALARAFSGRASPTPNDPTFASPSQLGHNNAFGRILGRSSQSSSRTSGASGQAKPEPGLTLATRPHSSVKAEPTSFTGPRFDRHHRKPPATESEQEEDAFRMSGDYADSDEETDTFGRHNPRPSVVALSQPSRSTLPSLPSPFSRPAYNPMGSVPKLPTLHAESGFPAIELARQSSMARQEGLPWPPIGPNGQRVHATHRGSQYFSTGYARPGFMSNGAYYAPPGPSAFPGSSLAQTISRVNGYDFNSMTDMHGNPLNERLTTFLDDYVNDPRKTEEDIQKLLSNIRPDMDVPEEERGETPEAMRYPLYPHQQLALKWMGNMEEGTNKGGILADDMGLGKTISTLALMVSRPSTDNVKTNLIIGPVALIKQWELEVKKKLKGSHQLNAFLFHSKKRPYSELKKYDVVLTTYGSVAAEWKRYSQHVEQRICSEGYREEDDMELFSKCPLLHPRSKFYRIILDEAQCIKNKDTQSSKGVHKINATYRWCLTGTPMMNGVLELYPLIRFLRIRPYCDFKTFQKTFKGLSAKGHVSDYTRDNAMRQLQAVLKAMMLRRMKDSMIDGKPILTLPPKTENSEHVVFSDDERQFYQTLEAQSQVQFNKFLRAGTVGKNYSNILVLLLRLRQACCHPHLTEFESSGAAVEDIDMVALAKELEDTVVERIKAIEAFECPICYDGVEDPLLVIPCGHDTCTECFTSLTENTAQDNIRLGEENRAARCPVCRGPVEPKRVITLTAFRKVHVPESLTAEEDAADEISEVPDSDDSDELTSDYESDSDADRFGNLSGFVVPDSEDGEDKRSGSAELDAELDAAAEAAKKEEGENLPRGTDSKNPKKSFKKAGKSRKKGGKAAGKRKAEEIKPHMLKQLRKDADKNRETRRRYMHYLRDNWEDSAKVTQVIELLQQIQETEEKTIIFSQWTTLLDMIECQIKYKLNLRYCRYTGKMSRNQRDEAVQDFVENPRNTVMLVSLRAGNAGLNLTVASRIIICDPFWNPFIEAQAVDRAHRIGQQREVKVHRILVKETVEDRILALQESKRKLVEAALDEGQSKNVGRLSEQELAYLFGVNPARR